MYLKNTYPTTYICCFNNVYPLWFSNFLVSQNVYFVVEKASMFLFLWKEIWLATIRKEAEIEGQCHYSKSLALQGARQS